MNSGAGAGSGKKILGAGAALKQFCSETLDSLVVKQQSRDRYLLLNVRN